MRRLRPVQEQALRATVSGVKPAGAGIQPVPRPGAEEAGGRGRERPEAAPPGQILDHPEPAADSGCASGAALCGAAYEAADPPSGADPGEANRYGIH